MRRPSTEAPASILQSVVIYDHPSDYPDHFVTRRWRVDLRGTLRASEPCNLHNSLEDARAHIRINHPNMVAVARGPNDHPCITETWL